MAQQEVTLLLLFAGVAGVAGALRWRHTKRTCPKTLPEIKSKASLQALVQSIDNFVLDCGGVVWLGPKLLPDVKEALTLLRKLKKKVLFVTNESGSRCSIKQKLDKLGLEVELEQIVTAASAAAAYCKSKNVNKVFLIGTKGLEEELNAAGATCVRMGEADKSKAMTEDRMLAWKIPADIRAVVVGGDNDFAFSQVCYASACLQEDETRPLLSCCRDAFDQLTSRRMPG